MILGALAILAQAGGHRRLSEVVTLISRCASHIPLGHGQKICIIRILPLWAFAIKNCQGGYGYRTKPAER